jgi:hypothetical protein
MEEKVLRNVRVTFPLTIKTYDSPNLRKVGSPAEIEDATRDVIITALVAMLGEDLYDLSHVDVEDVK